MGRRAEAVGADSDVLYLRACELRAREILFKKPLSTLPVGEGLVSKSLRKGLERPKKAEFGLNKEGRKKKKEGKKNNKQYE